MNVGDAIDDSSLAKGCKTCSSVSVGRVAPSASPSLKHQIIHQSMIGWQSPP